MQGRLLIRSQAILRPTLRRCPVQIGSPVSIFTRSMSDLKDVEVDDVDVKSFVHFRASGRAHPLNVKKPILDGDHLGRQQNYIWSEEELKEKMTNLTHHQPKTFSDYVMNKLMFGLYHTFNFITGYKPMNPTVDAMKWRLIVLESIAGVPGFVAAGVRHFRSLRGLKRDHGWISTLLEEAENERMHLLICLSTFEATLATRMLVLAAQYIMVPFLLGVYMVHPRSMHRFVGYLEETACSTYVNTIKHIETPGTRLHEAWAKVPAPTMARGYYRLPEDAMWVDCLKCMMADEANHRDVNHTFASMKVDDPNPFLEVHRANVLKALELEREGKPAFTKQKEPKEKQLIY